MTRADLETVRASGSSGLAVATMIDALTEAADGILKALVTIMETDAARIHGVYNFDQIAIAVQATRRIQGVPVLEELLAAMKP